MNDRKQGDYTKEGIAIKDLVEYQDDSIVSKVLIDKEAGTVTLFAFDKGQGLSEHTAPFDAMVNVLEGDVRITVSKKEYNIKGGEIIIMPANEPHSLMAVSRFKMVLVMIKRK